MIWRSVAAGAICAILSSHGARSEIPAGFVYLRDVAPDVLQDIRYAGVDNFTGQRVPGYEASECILRRDAAEALQKAQVALGRQSLGLKVYDCYRPARATAFFIKWMQTRPKPRTIDRYHPRIDRRSLRALGYVSPSSSHSRGLAVDLTLVSLPVQPQRQFDPAANYGLCTGDPSQRSPDNSVDMGTSFDCFDIQSHANFAVLSEAQRTARNVLRNVMRRHGFEAYSREWWHFTFTATSRRDVGASDFVIEPRLP